MKYKLPNPMSKPKVFIGFTTKGLQLTESIPAKLDYFGQVTVWHHNVFQLSPLVISSLLNALIAATGPFTNFLKISICEALKLKERGTLPIYNIEIGLHVLEAYFKRKGISPMSFDKISENVDPLLNKAFLMDVIRDHPYKIFIAKPNNQKYGIKPLTLHSRKELKRILKGQWVKEWTIKENT